MTPSPFLHRFTVTAADVLPADVWRLYDDTSTWPMWDAGLERIERESPLADGAHGTMLLKGAPDPLAFVIEDVQPGRSFTDVTAVGDVVVRVEHRAQPAAPQGTRITHTVAVDGPADAAQEVGAMVCSDFPETMDALVTLARGRR
jgi:hypothetical protein